MLWIKFWDEKIKLIAKNSNSILDVGGDNRLQKGMKEYEEIFKSKNQTSGFVIFLVK